MSTLKYHVDQVEVKENIIIKGWIFSETDEMIFCEVNGTSIQLERGERPDVQDCHPDFDNALLSGFEINVPYTNKLILTFKDSTSEVVDTIDASRIRKNYRKEKRKAFLEKISFSNIIKGLKYLIKNGFKKTIKKIREYLNKEDISSITLYEKTVYPESELKIQRKTRFNYEPKISIVVPLYNTPKEFLEEMIESVKNQTYQNWELCLADGSDDNHIEVENISKEFSKKDSKIKYKKLVENKGISGNTNECLDMATGDYIGLFDHDDLLHPAALFEIVKKINEENADFLYTDEITFMGEIENVFNPHFKPDFAIDNLRANNYICHFTVFSYELFKKTGYFREEYDGSQDYDMVLRLTENAQRICHIPKILYYWRAHKNSVASDVSAKPYVIESAHKALKAHLERLGIKGTVEDTRVVSMYKINYEIEGEPLISIIIPNKDHIEDIDKCLSSIEDKTTYKNYEIIIVENNSIDEKTFEYYNRIKSDKIKVITYQGGFNYSAINNLGFTKTKGDYILLLNNDVEVISEHWLEEMLMYCQREDVGAVGAKLYYPDDTIQHAGLGLGILQLAGHYHRHFQREHPGYMGRLSYAHDVTAVTAACLMVKRSVYQEVNGLDESFEVAFNDVDFCMKIREKGYLIVFTPFAELYHYESKSRGLDSEPEKRERFLGEVTRFQKKWEKKLEEGDPYYNANLTLEREDFGIK